MQYNCDWDPKKAQINKEKHEVTFEEAASVFLDPRMLTIYDTDHSEQEERWVTLGLSDKGRLLLVYHTFREEKSTTAIIRIFSSRKATKQHAKQYQET